VIKYEVLKVKIMMGINIKNEKKSYELRKKI
jgi:hypothetical protein